MKNNPKANPDNSKILKIQIHIKEEQDKITHKIIGCVMEVHNTLGNGFQEVIYQRCLSIELSEKGIEHQREVEMPIFYKGNDVGLRRADFLVMGEIMVELKAIIDLEDVHLAQAMNYLEAYNLPTGLLINFGAKSLQFKRIFNKSWQSRNLTNHGSDNE
ncbi:MAG: GxxExxY protein [Flavobacteriales bacterium]|nr:GxxExxY protein [Flavobacteriales bacterium]